MSRAENANILNDISYEIDLFVFYSKTKKEIQYTECLYSKENISSHKWAHVIIKKICENSSREKCKLREKWWPPFSTNFDQYCRFRPEMAKVNSSRSLR